MIDWVIDLNFLNIFFTFSRCGLKIFGSGGKIYSGDFGHTSHKYFSYHFASPPLYFEISSTCACWKDLIFQYIRPSIKSNRLWLHNAVLGSIKIKYKIFHSLNSVNLIWFLYISFFWFQTNMVSICIVNILNVSSWLLFETFQTYSIEKTDNE